MEFYENIIPVSTKELYTGFDSIEEMKDAMIHTFVGVEENDVYNPSIPFELDGVTYIAGRVEHRDSENSKVMFFKENKGNWDLCKSAKTFDLQDPFITWIDGQLIFGGVRTIIDEATDKITSWCTDFYKGSNLMDLTYFTSGPTNMKDIRLIQLKDKRIGIFTRPQGLELLAKTGYIAELGFTIVNTLEDITPESIEDAPLLKGYFLPDEWGGCNQAHLLKDGNIGVIGHIAYGEGNEISKVLHYYGMSFILNPETRKITTPKIIVTRKCFPDGSVKKIELSDVTFIAGITRGDNHTATIYTGLSDSQVGSVRIKDPFSEWENRMES